MKAEHRHELKENDLVQAGAKAIKVMQLPDLRRKLLLRILAVLATIIVIVAVIKMRISNAEHAVEEASDHLAIARQMLTELRAMMPAPDLDEKFFDMVQQQAERTTGELEKVNVTGDEKLLAQAVLLRGDLNYYMATMPVATARAGKQAPDLRQSREDYLSAASSAYQEVVDKYTDQPISLMTAHFGLAAVMENRSYWDDAAKHYREVLNNSDSGPAFKALAQQRINDLAVLMQPLLLERSARPALISLTATKPSTGPSTTQATTQGTPATTQSTTRAVAEATSKPATAPAAARGAAPMTRPATTAATKAVAAPH